MRSLPLALLTVVALVTPAAALAAGSATPPPNRSFVITGLILGDRKIEASGKLSIEGSQLLASVGCNTIGGQVTLDGDTLTIPQPLVTTEMACPGVSGDNEAMLIKILQAGPFTIGSGQWAGNDAAILVEELPPGPGPGASISPPDDGVVSTGPVPRPIEPTVSCPPAPNEIDGTSPASGPDAGSTGGSSGSGSSGIGSSGSGSSGSGSSGAETVPASTAIDLPLPAATAVDLPAPAGTAVPEPAIGSDPGVGKPLVSDPCLDFAASDQVNAGGTEGQAPKAAGATAEHAATSSDSSVIVPVGIGLAVVLVAGILGALRLRTARSREGASRGGAA